MGSHLNINNFDFYFEFISAKSLILDPKTKKYGDIQYESYYFSKESNLGIERLKTFKEAPLPVSKEGNGPNTGRVRRLNTKEWVWVIYEEMSPSSPTKSLGLYLRLHSRYYNDISRVI